jgi:hypothetical protein
MNLEEVRSELTKLHADAADLLSTTLLTRTSERLVLFRGPLEDVEHRLDTLVRRFVVLDAELIRHASAPSDYNTAVRNAAQFSFYTSVRDSVRGLLTDVSQSSGYLRSRLDFLGSLWLSLVALILAVVALFK